MPRPLRASISGQVYHVINRGSGGAVVFHQNGDYLAFLKSLAEAKTRFPVKVLAFCLMPNHFHAVLEPTTDQALSPFMQWWQSTYAQRNHLHHGGHGHIWQGRFKSFLIQQDEHLLTVLRYILRNPVRSGLVNRTDQWPWSSPQHQALADPWPVEIGRGWADWVEEPLPPTELTRLRTSVNRQAPFGSAEWQRILAHAMGIESTLRREGRPRTQNGV